MKGRPLFGRSPLFGVSLKRVYCIYVSVLPTGRVQTHPHFCVAYVAVDLRPPHHCRQRYNSTAVSPLVSGGGPVSD